MSKQKTLKGSFSLCGKGLHTGLSLTVTFNPAPENTGYKIQRIDLEGQPIILAVAENVVETQRGTVLGKGDIRVSTIEHGMSALYALKLPIFCFKQLFSQMSLLRKLSLNNLIHYFILNFFPSITFITSFAQFLSFHRVHILIFLMLSFASANANIFM